MVYMQPCLWFIAAGKLLHTGHTTHTVTCRAPINNHGMTGHHKGIVNACSAGWAAAAPTQPTHSSGRPGRPNWRS